MANKKVLIKIPTLVQLVRTFYQLEYDETIKNTPVRQDTINLNGYIVWNFKTKAGRSFDICFEYDQLFEHGYKTKGDISEAWQKFLLKTEIIDGKNFLVALKEARMVAKVQERTRAIERHEKDKSEVLSQIKEWKRKIALGEKTISGIQTEKNKDESRLKVVQMELDNFHKAHPKSNKDYFCAPLQVNTSKSSANDGMDTKN